LNRPPGVQFEMGYALDLFKPIRGGVCQDQGVLGNLDLLLHLSLNPLLGLRRTSIRVHVQSSHGESISAAVGDLQGMSNLEAPREWRLYEAWIGHQFGSPRLSLLAGVYDVNSEFDVIPGAGHFLNSSFGFGPDFSRGGVVGPSTYPATGLAARLRFEPSVTSYGLLGVSDGVPGDQGRGRFSLDAREGALLSFELGYARPLSDAVSISDPTGQVSLRGPGQAGTIGPVLAGTQRRQIGRGRRIEEVSAKVAFGGWVYTARKEGWVPEASLGRSWGLYLLAERLFLQRSDGTGALSGFARVGTASDDVNQVDLSLGGGIVYRGPVSGRPDDVAGIGMYRVRNGSPFLEDRESGGIAMEEAETVVEVTYSAEFGGFLVVQPDVQWVRNPGMNPDLDDALVFGLRAHVLVKYPGGRAP